MSKTGERIHYARKAAGLTARELARYIGVTEKTVLRYENDQSVPDSHSLIQLACIDFRFAVLDFIEANYKAKKHKDAEELFLQLISCGFADVEINARNNLSFMMRRGETAAVEESFWEMLEPVPDAFIFKQMNIALYCIIEKKTDDERFDTAINCLKAMTDQEKEELSQCWADIEFVGKDESKLALSIIEGKYSGL